MFRTPKELALALGAGVQNKFTRAITEPTPLNFIADFVPNPCDHGLTLIAIMALPAAADAVVELLTPGEHSILRGAVEPKLRRRFFRSRKGITAEEKAADEAIKLDIPDTGLLIGNNLPGAQLFKNRIPGPIESAAWGLLDVAETAAWYVLLGELAHDTAMRWTSAVYAVHNSECDKVPMPRGLGTGIRSPIMAGEGNTGPGWIETINYQHDSITSTDLYTTWAYPFSGYIHYSCFLVNTFTETMIADVRIEANDSHGRHITAKATQARIEAGGAAVMNITHHFHDIINSTTGFYGQNIQRIQVVNPLYTFMHDNLKKTIKVGG